jgi:hypothetical protein
MATIKAAVNSNKSSVGRGKAGDSGKTEVNGALSVEAASRQAENDPAPETCGSRFRFFIIDSGWKSQSAKVIRDNFSMIREYLEGDALYVLSREQSLSLVRRHPDMIGKDPIIMVQDMHAHNYHEEAGEDEDDDDYHGFRLNLGMIADGEIALDALQRFLRFVSIHRRSSDIERDVKDKLHRDGIKGSIEIIRSGSKDVMGG